MRGKSVQYGPMAQISKNVQTAVDSEPNNVHYVQATSIATDPLAIAVLAAISGAIVGAIATESVKILMAKLKTLDIQRWEHKKADDMLVAISIVQSGKLVLMAERRRVQGSPLGWSFPSARVRRGEVITERIKERYKDKYGVEVEPIKKLGESYIPQQNLKILYFHCKYDKGTLENLDPQEIEEVSWVDVREAEETADARVHPDLANTLTRIMGN